MIEKILLNVIHRLNNIIAENAYDNAYHEEQREAYDCGFTPNYNDIQHQYAEGEYHCDIDKMIGQETLKLNKESEV